MTFLRLIKLTCAALALAGAASLAHAGETKITIDNFTFNPPTLTVKAGTTVTWTNQDDIPHTIANPPAFRSKPLDTEQSYSFTFTTPGTYTYFCSLHPHMTGTIVVEEKTGAVQ